MRTIAQKLMPRPKPITRPGLVFVRGHPRSGTNWVGALLNLHPQVYCTGEFHLEPVYHAVEHAKTYPWQLVHDEPVRSELDRALQDLVRRCITTACKAQRPDLHPRWYGDRTPRDLMDWMPGERYVWILRDGRDVAVSWTFHQLRLGKDVIEKSTQPPATEHLLRLSDDFHKDPDLFRKHPERLLDNEAWVRFAAKTWNHRYRADSRHGARMDTDATTSRLLRMRYEKLRTDTEAERERLYRFLDLDPTVAKPMSRKDGTLPGVESEDALAFRRKGEVGDWTNYFTPQAKAWFNDIAGQSMIDAGYAQDAKW